jgi:putative choline sulfate-utilization transcription factor
MNELRRHLPPLDTLVAFEAAARLLSFTAAARELSVTQAAISQQIRNLESNLGIRLFARSHRAVQLTQAGRNYQHSVYMALTHLADATKEVRTQPRGARLAVAADQSFASMWLMPRLPRFQQAHPQISVRLVASDDVADCLAGGIQVAIVHGHGEWHGFHLERLFAEEVFPVCSPGFLAENAGIASPADLAETVLLDLEDDHWNWMTWRIWLTENGVSLPAGRRPLQINNYPLVIEAAKNGQGVALGWRYLVDHELSRGQLVRPIEASLETALGYYLVWPANEMLRPEAEAFCDWIRQELECQRLHDLPGNRGVHAAGDAIVGVKSE